MLRLKQTFTLLISSLLLTAMVGCQGAYNRKMSPMMDAYTTHDFDLAAMHAQERVTNAHERTQLLVLLEYGSVLHTAGRWAESNTALQQADDLWEDYQSQADLDITDESFATLTKQSQLPYRGRAYDGIMMNTLMALNYMALGDLDNARVQVDRAYFRQKDAVFRNAKRIEKAQEQADKKANKDRYDTDRAQKDPRFSHGADDAYAEMNEDVASYAAYTNYVNPFAQFVRGLFLMTAGQDSADLETARVVFENLLSMVPDPKYVTQDLALAERVAQGSPMPSITYVVLETGLSPRRESIPIDIPIFLVGDKRSGGVDYVGAAFPRLKKQDPLQRIPFLNVHAAGQQHKTLLLCSMDAVVTQDFKNELPLIITRTLLSTGIKATSAYFMNKATESDAVLNIITRVSATAYQKAMNEADVRTWLTLPKEIRYCRFETPADGIIDLHTPPGTTGPAPGSTRLTVDPDLPVNLVIVKSVQKGLPLAITQYRLSNEATVATTDHDEPVAIEGDISP